MQVVPFDKVIKPSDKVKLDVRLFDAKGNRVAPQAATFTLEGLKGTVAADGTFTPDAAAGLQAGTIKATVGTLSGVSRVRVMPPLPVAYNFDDITGEAPPAAWIRATGVFKVADLDGSARAAASRGQHAGPPRAPVPRHGRHARLHDRGGRARHRTAPPAG